MNTEKKYKLVMCVAKVDEENYPGIKLFDDALNEANKDLYRPIPGTFRVLRVEGNILFVVITELNDLPEFLGSGAGFKTG